MTRDERETLQALRKPASLPTLIERLGLSGDTDEVIALCKSIDGLIEKHLVTQDEADWAIVRWRQTTFGRAWLEGEVA